MRIVLIIVSILWLIIFVDTVTEANFYEGIYMSGIHNGLMIFSLVMAVVVPIVFMLKLLNKSLRAHHVIAICAWILFLVSVYHEVVIEQAF